MKQPIDLLKIQQKIRSEDYDDIEDLSIDLQQLVNNAQSYYKVMYWANGIIWYTFCNYIDTHL